MKKPDPSLLAEWDARIDMKDELPPVGQIEMSMVYVSGEEALLRKRDLEDKVASDLDARQKRRDEGKDPDAEEDDEIDEVNQRWIEMDPQDRRSLLLSRWQARVGIPWKDTWGTCVDGNWEKLDHDAEWTWVPADWVIAVAMDNLYGRPWNRRPVSMTTAFVVMADLACPFALGRPLTAYEKALWSILARTRHISTNASTAWSEHLRYVANRTASARGISLVAAARLAAAATGTFWVAPASQQKSAKAIALAKDASKLLEDPGLIPKEIATIKKASSRYEARHPTALALKLPNAPALTREEVVTLEYVFCLADIPWHVLDGLLKRSGDETLLAEFEALTMCSICKKPLERQEKFCDDEEHRRERVSKALSVEGRERALGAGIRRHILRLDKKCPAKGPQHGTVAATLSAEELKQLAVKNIQGTARDLLMVRLSASQVWVTSRWGARRGRRTKK